MRSVSKGKNCLGRNTLHRVWAISEDERPRNMGWLVFMGWVISQTNEWEDYSKYFGGKGWRFPGIGPPPTF